MAIEIFAKLGDIKGESSDTKHKDEIEILSYSWGVSQSTPPGGGNGPAIGTADIRELAIMHTIDKATPRLLRACATGEHIKEATITHRKAGKNNHEYLIVKMNDVIVTTVQHNASTFQEGTGTESVLLRFSKVDFTYKATKADGSLDAGITFKYDLNARKAL